MAITVPGGATEVRANAYRLSLAPSRVYACRVCREAVRVTSTRYLPATCPACAAATWEDDGRCGNWIHCSALRRAEARPRSFCPACGHSVWVEVHLRSAL